MEISKKQSQLYQDIISQEKPKISVLGSTQSGKTYIISLATIKYAIELSKYDSSKTYYGAIVGWSVDTLKRNICNVMEGFLTSMGLRKKRNSFDNNYDYDIQWGTSKYIQINNIVFYFFGFNTAKSFNKILGDPLVYVWIDESARIYSSSQLQESFDEFPGRQLAYVSNPYRKMIHSFNVEGNENHPYKIKYIDNFDGIKYVFYPYDNPLIKTEADMNEVINQFPPGSLREQKIYNKWVIAEGKVFQKINKIKDLSNITIREIGIGQDYGSVNPTTFVPIALCYDRDKKKWILIRLPVYYHNPSEFKDNPTTEYFSNQFRTFTLYLKQRYGNIPITDNVVDSEATHYINRLKTDGIKVTPANKYPGSVDDGVQYMQSLFEKEYLYILEGDSITNFYPGGTYEESNKDESLIEFESYQYDTIRSQKEGINCYKKELDHSIDATRYLLLKWKKENKAPMV